MDTQKQKEIPQEFEFCMDDLNSHNREKTDNSWAESDTEINHRATRRELAICIFLCLLFLAMRAGVLPVHKSGFGSIVAMKSRVGRFSQPEDQSPQLTGWDRDHVANASAGSMN